MDLSWLLYALFVSVPFALALLAVAVIGVVKGHRWLWIAGASSTLQIFTLPIAGIFPSLNLLSSLAAIKGIMARELWRLTWMWAAAAVTVVLLVSSGWSPSPIAGLREFIYALPFFLLVGSAFLYAQTNPSGASRLVTVALWLSVVQPVLIIVFRVLPSVEGQFITSAVARLFISPNVIASLFNGTPNNVFDAGKAGGLFVNANTAATYAGCCAMLAWHFAASKVGKGLTIVAVLHWVSVPFTGSKAGMICALLVPMIIFGFGALRGLRLSMLQVALLCIGVSAVGALAPLAWDLYVESGFTRASADTLSVRQRIWGFAWSMFLKYPMQGLGHGGWENSFPLFALAQGLNPNYPPHNMFMQLWSRGGLLAVVSGVVFSVAFLSWFTRLAWQRIDGLSTQALGVASAFLWIFIQAQGENFGILGEPHITTMLALSAGVVAGSWHRHAVSAHPEK